MSTEKGSQWSVRAATRPDWRSSIREGELKTPTTRDFVGSSMSDVSIQIRCLANYDQISWPDSNWAVWRFKWDHCYGGRSSTPKRNTLLQTSEDRTVGGSWIQDFPVWGSSFGSNLETSSWHSSNTSKLRDFLELETQCKLHANKLLFVRILLSISKRFQPNCHSIPKRFQPNCHSIPCCASY